MLDLIIIIIKIFKIILVIYNKNYTSLYKIFGIVFFFSFFYIYFFLKLKKYAEKNKKILEQIQSFCFLIFDFNN